MDSYQTKQLHLIKKLEEGFKKGKQLSTVVEPVSDYVNDNRICLTSVVFLPQRLEKRIIDNVISPLQKINPTQYFYISGSFHVTIQNVRTIEYPPLFSDEDVKRVREVFKRIVPKHSYFTLNIKRLFELPTSLAISAFSNETLANLALELRKELKKAGVPDNKTYVEERVVIGSTTICRFTNGPTSVFRQKVKELKELEIGEFKVKKISLITTNAFCHPLKTKIIEEYSLANGDQCGLL